MRIGMLRKVDSLGRLVIPKEYRDFYHLNSTDTVCMVETVEGLLITNPEYEVVKIEKE